MQVDYKEFEDYSSIPKDKKVTIVDVPHEFRSDEIATVINVGNYFKGNLVKGSLEKFDIAEINDRIANFDYQDAIYVHVAAKDVFDIVWNGAGIYKKAKGDPKEIQKILIELENIRNDYGYIEDYDNVTE